MSLTVSTSPDDLDPPALNWGSINFKPDEQFTTCTYAGSRYGVLLVENWIDSGGRQLTVSRLKSAGPE
jgi:hypothetical protein